MNKETTISTRLQELEDIIQRGLDGFEKAGNALIEIRNQRLYKDTHDTFEAYCRERWSMSRRHANRLIEASETADTLGPTGPKPKSERQIRPLAGLLPGEQKKIWQEAVQDANGKDPTSKQVEAAKVRTLNELVPRIKENLAKLAAADIKAAVYHIFEASQKEMRRFKTKAEQQKFKAALLGFLKTKLIPITPVSTKRK